MSLGPSWMEQFDYGSRMRAGPPSLYIPPQYFVPTPGAANAATAGAPLSLGPGSGVNGVVAPPVNLNHLSFHLPQQSQQQQHATSQLEVDVSSRPKPLAAVSTAVPAPYSPPPTASHRDPKVISCQELMQLLLMEGAAPPTDRPETGQLNDCRFYTPKTPRKEHYLLFACKGDYISYFVHYYFSSANMQRDTTLQSLLVEEGTTVPLENLMQFPRLVQVRTTEDDLLQALENSYKLEVVETNSGKRGVRRQDGWSPLPSPMPSNPPSGTVTPQLWMNGGGGAPGTRGPTPTQQQQPNFYAPVPPPSQPLHAFIYHPTLPAYFATYPITHAGNAGGDFPLQFGGPAGPGTEMGAPHALLHPGHHFAYGPQFYVTTAATTAAAMPRQ